MINAAAPAWWGEGDDVVGGGTGIRQGWFAARNRGCRPDHSRGRPSLPACARSSWPEQVAAAVRPITLLAFYGSHFHHPHLRGGAVGDWPLNVFPVEQVAAELPALRAIVSAELHNLVYQCDFRIVPATVRGRRPA